MHKLLSIAREEMVVYLRQWTFYLSLAIMVGTFLAVGAFPQLQQAAEESPLSEIETVFTVEETITVPTGFVDHANLIHYIPDDQAENFRAFPDEASADTALQAAEIESYYIIAADFIETGLVRQITLDATLMSNTDAAVENLLQQNLLLKIEDHHLADRFAVPFYLVREGPPRPVFRFIPEETDLSVLASAGLLAMLFTYLTNASGFLLLTALNRESEARILETLVSSTTPAQFIGGKLLGLSTLVMGQASLALVGGILVYGNDPGSGPAALPLHVILVAIPYLLLGYLGFSLAMLAVAAVFPTLKENFQLQFFMRMVILSPLVGVLFVLPNPHSTASLALTVFPLTAPLLMPFRMMLSSVPGIQIAVGLGLLLVWDGVQFWLTTRLFRAHSLLTGRTATPRALWAVLKG
ncbi:MAG TPA: ABC transporter permease [Anaerolineales bacterium]|nr:ABC transporter permease [Anaerolineales bacterium]